MVRRRIAVVVSVLMLLGVTAALPAQAEWRRSWDRVAYAMDGDIYTVRADGSGLERLTWTGDNLAPAWSPDGLRLAFASRRDGDFEIYTMTAWGSHLRQLTDNTEQDSDPVWSPDGQLIVFTRSFTFTSGYGEEHGRRLWVMEADGSDSRHLQSAVQDWTGEEFRAPVWSPDGERVAALAYWIQRLNDESLYITDLSGNDAWPWGSLYSRPSWKPDGTAVVSCGGSGDPDPAHWDDQDCWQVPLEGSPAPIASSRSYRETTAMWSPNGQYLAIGRNVRNDAGSGQPGPPIVTVQEADGSLRDLASGLTPVGWSPDSRYLLATDDGALSIIAARNGWARPLGVTGEEATWRPLPYCRPGVTAPTCPTG